MARNTPKGTKKQRSDSKKKELAENLEYLRQVEVHESQGGGRKFVHDTRQEEKKEDQKQEDTAKNNLESRIDAKFSYRRQLAEYALKRIMNQDPDSDWDIFCVPTDGSVINIFGKRYKTQEGVIYVLRSPKKNVYVRAVRTCYDPEIDIGAIERAMIHQAMNTIDSEKGILLSDNKDTLATFKRTKSGIILPN